MLTPSISAGCGSPKILSIVGAISARVFHPHEVGMGD